MKQESALSSWAQVDMDTTPDYKEANFLGGTYYEGQTSFFFSQHHCNVPIFFDSVVK